MLRVLVLVIAVHAQAEEIVVEGWRDQAPPTSITILTAADIEKKHAQTTVDLLRDLPGVGAIQSGGIGQPTSVSIRGARAEDTLVLIDGVPVNDVMAPSGGYDFSSLLPQDIERIEVYRGPQSFWYGAGALGGVINVVTRMPTSTPTAQLQMSAGSYNTQQTGLRVAGGSENLRNLMSINCLQTAGFSAADHRQGNSEKDGARIVNIDEKSDWHINSQWQSDASIHFSRASADLDSGGGAGADDLFYTADTNHLVIRAGTQAQLLDDRLHSTLHYAFSEFERTDVDSPDALNSTSLSDHYLSESQKIDSLHDLKLTDNAHLRGGLDYLNESGTGISTMGTSSSTFARRRRESWGQALSYDFDNLSWLSGLGLRHDQIVAESENNSYRAYLGHYFLTQTMIFRVDVGTGFKSPSLFQLYSNYGDTHLQPEHSRSLDFALAYRPTPNWTTSLNWFRNQFYNMIDFGATSNHYENVGLAHSQGLEGEIKYGSKDGFHGAVQTTWMSSRDDESGQRLLRRTDWVLSGNVGNRFLGKDLTLNYRHVGARPDVDPITFNVINNSAYDVFSAHLIWPTPNSGQWSLSVENIFNEHYQEIVGYGTPELSVYLGYSAKVF